MTTPAPDAGPSGAWFWGALALGWVVLAYGIWGVFADAGRTSPLQLAGYVVGFAVVHDVVVVPIAVAAGWLAARWLPEVSRGPLCGALALSALVIVFAYPLVRRLGARPTNSSALPLDYSRNLAVVLGAVWLVAGLIVLARIVRRRRRHLRSSTA
jgi:hypothetical protein